MCLVLTFLHLRDHHHHHHHYVTPSAQISLILSRTPPYRPSLPPVPQGYVTYLHRKAAQRLKLVTLPLLGHVKGSTRIHHK